MGGGKKDPQADMVNGNHGVLLAESIAVSVVLRATDINPTAQTAERRWTEAAMKTENGKIIEATRKELYNIWLTEEWDEILTFPDFLLTMERVGVKVTEGKPC